jgi:ABC-type branched-subunit amino acid transport system substrate-binding protein
MRGGSKRLIGGLVIGVLVLAGLSAVPAGAAKSAAAAKCADPSGTVKLGMSYFGNVGGALESIGANETAELTPADKAIVDGYQAGIDALNKAGGLAGCQVEKVVFNFKAQGVDFNQQSQQECAAFTQDTKVLAVYAGAFETKVALDCYAKAKTAMFQIGNNYPPTCEDEIRDAGYIYTPANVATCRFGAFIPIWKKAGLFPTAAKVGIVVVDDGSGQNQALADKIWTPALKKLKIPAESFVIPSATSSAGFSETSAAASQGLLKFKSDGVNVVLFTPSGGQAAAAFLSQAAGQSFFPAYGFDTVDGLAVSQTLGAAAIKEKGIAISWAIGDLPLQAQNTLPKNPAITKCAAWSTPSQTTLTGSSTYCDFLSLLQQALGSAPKADAATLKKAVEAMGTTFVSSVTYDGATKFGKNRYDGVNKVRLLEFDPNTKTFNFMAGNSKTYTIP